MDNLKINVINAGEKTADQINEMIDNLKEGEMISINFDNAKEGNYAIEIG